MSGIIKLLPDSVANQIAAGEVVQRPASAVKEMLENALDAGATEIKLIIKDAGRTLIQVIDNGKGMSETDARMCFERHATSKISSADDLFRIRSMGFRGEALASIASIAQVELKTKQKADGLGTHLIIEGSQLKEQTPCQCADGTSLMVKNLFYNTPARRQFLKADHIERKHILTEFTRVAMAFPEVAFYLYQNNQLTHQLESTHLKNRIASLMGGLSYNQKLMPVEETTNLIGITGYVCKPEFARKTKGEQYFYVNQRFIKSPYFNHAVESAYQELIPDNSNPSYFLFFDCDPSQIDVNVHPTKTEIKFTNEKEIYAIIKAAVKKALGKYSLSPSLDFERETIFDQYKFDPQQPVKIPTIEVNPDYNPFAAQQAPKPHIHKNLNSRANPGNWEKLFPTPKTAPAPENEDKYDTPTQTVISSNWDKAEENTSIGTIFQVHKRYIFSQVKSGIMVIDLMRAKERILYEKYARMLAGQKGLSQQELFPRTLEFPDLDAELLRELIPDLALLGFDVGEFGQNSFIVHGIPADMGASEDIKASLDGILENYKKNQIDLKIDSRINLARSMARNMAVNGLKKLNNEEMTALIDTLFGCELPYQNPGGKPTFFILSIEELEEKFR